MSSSQPFSENEISQINKLEQLFHNKYLTPDFLHELVALYVRAIDAFRNDFSFMRAYFLDKMQFMLSRPEVIKMLEGGSFQDQIRETLRMTEREQPVVAQQPKVETREIREIREKREEHHHHYHYDENKSKERGMKIDMKMKLMREVEENMKNLKQEMADVDKKIEENDKKVKNIARDQDDKIKQRLEKRKKKLRKKSVEIKAKKAEGMEDEEPEPPVVKKEELIEAQRELTQAVINFTIRMTEKNNKEESKSKENKKGRVKIQQIEEEEDDEEKEREKAVHQGMKKNKETQGVTKGRVKTRRPDEEEEENSQYF